MKPEARATDLQYAGSEQVLVELIARLEKATGPDRELDGEIFWHVERRRATTAYWNATVGMPKPLGEYMPKSGLGHRAIVVSAPTYSESIDAALTLVPEGMNWWAGLDYGLSPMACVYPQREEQRDWIKATTPALALCIAALKSRLPNPR